MTTELSKSDASTFTNDGALRLRAVLGWMYSTPIAHASDAARRPANRRVLQVDFAARDLPGGLVWLGV